MLLFARVEVRETFMTSFRELRLAEAKNWGYVYVCIHVCIYIYVYTYNTYCMTCVCMYNYKCNVIIQHTLYVCNMYMYIYI